MFVLSCLHTAYFPPPHPRSGELVYCIRCNEPKRIAKPPSGYEVKCRDCKRANRHYGEAFVTAETRAVSHATRHAGHRVTLWYDGKQVRDFYRETLAIGDMPPF